MRILYTGLILFLALSAFAQDEKMPYYIQQAPVQEVAADCFQRKLDEGLEAQKRGDCRLALRWFRDAQACPEVLRMPERLEELQNLIAQCEDVQEKAEPAPAAGQKTTPATTPADAPAVRRRYRPSREFLEFDKPECFDITTKEAARAFSGGYWDDAAALYRAAKNCSDADQADRQEANRRITACRVASQNELRKKEQEAVYQARHAIAANRANDARRLLNQSDRSLAYRLADFANEYIAPNDNDACRQVMFDAIYHAPGGASGMGDEATRTPFGYQLGDNLDANLQVRFLGKNNRAARICAFARNRHLLFQWDAQSYEPETPVALEDTTLAHFDALPDGRTLLFYSQNNYLFWRSAREIFRLPTQQTGFHCWNESGTVFYFLNVEDMQVYSLDLRDAFATRKGSSQRAAPKPCGIFADYGISRIAAGNGQIWAGYRDHVLCYAQDDADPNAWEQQYRFDLAFQTGNYSAGMPPYMWLEPQSRSVLFTNDTMAVYYRLPDSDADPVEPMRFLPGNAMAMGAGNAFVATYQVDLFENRGRILLYTPEDGRLKFLTETPIEQVDMHLSSGVFSPDNRLFATTTYNGKLEIWELDNNPNEQVLPLGRCRHIAPGADGRNLFLWRNDSILLVNANSPTRIRKSIPAPEDTQPFLLAAKNWVAYRSGPDALVLSNKLDQPVWTVPSPEGEQSPIVGAFRSDEQMFACLAGSDSVAVYDLTTGQAVAGRRFAGVVVQVHYVPKTNEILVLLWTDVEQLTGEQSVIKLWDPALEPDAKARSVRLQGYNTLNVSFSERLGYIAFTDGVDIRVFRQNDLLDEAVRIRQNSNQIINFIDFHPTEPLLAAGYSDGTVIFWDITTGQDRFSWAKPHDNENQDFSSIARLRFLDNGRRLLTLFWENSLLVRDLDVSLIRNKVQTDFRKLIAFLPSQIREFNLEQAFDYPNNFSRLAASGDLPLIRSFFDYFRETALNSNNIERVGNSCSRASILYGQLDKSTQSVLRPILLEMFEDYHWKLLLRNQTPRAQKIAEAIKREFDNPVAATRAAAHTALMRSELRDATRLYAEWALLRADAENGYGIIDRPALEGLQYQLRQLLEYDLIQPEQLQCPCELFGDFPIFKSLCEKAPPVAPTVSNLSADMRLRWRIFEQLNTAQFLKNNRRRVRTLESALKDARSLQRTNATAYQDALEKVVLALGQAYASWGDFEQNNALAVRYYQKALEQLNASGAFRQPGREQARQSAIASCYLSLGAIYQTRGNTTEAQNACQQGLRQLDRLFQHLGQDTIRKEKLREDLRGNLQVQSGMVYLLQGNAQAALQAFERAQDDFREGIHRLYFGHAALLANNEIEALLEYGNIYDDNVLGKALFDIEQMAAFLPDQRERLTGFLQRLRDARLSTRPQMDATATDYYWAERKIRPLAARERWDAALNWSREAARLAFSLKADAAQTPFWAPKWLDATLNQTYYLLFSPTPDPVRLMQIDSLCRVAQVFLDDDFQQADYANRALFQTNLAHAYWLRGQPGDRAKALDLYRNFLRHSIDAYDPWEVLLKDFRDLVRAGVPWPDLQALIREILPQDAVMEADDWEALKLAPPVEDSRGR